MRTVPSQISSDIYTFWKTQYEWVFCLFALKLLLCICTVWYLRIFMNFKLVEVRHFCSHTHFQVYKVMLKTLTALQRNFHDCLNLTLILKSMKWGLPEKMLFSFTWWVFSPPYKAPASTPPGFCSVIHLFHLLFLLPPLDAYRKWIQSIM